ncbi:MAG: PAS domain S-box protein [bacterium]|nr:PAS domain S-box protein [bacterium]
MKYSKNEELRASEERYRSLVELSPDGIAVYSDAVFVYVNAAAARIIGAKGEMAEYFIGKSVMEFVRSDYRDLFKEQLRQIQEGKTLGLTHYVFIRTDGSEIDGEGVAAPVTYGGKPAVQTVIRDITERKRMEDALRDSEKRYRSLVEQSPDGIAVYSDRIVLYVNSAAACIIGAKGENPEYFIGKSVMGFIHPDYWELLEERLQQIQEGSTVGLTNYVFVRTDGTEIDVEATSAPIIYEGKPAVQAVFRDITEQKRIEKAREELVFRLQEIDSIRNEFIALAAHELRTPLTPIRGIVDLLCAGRLGILTNKQEEMLRVARVQSERLQNLIDDMVDLSMLQGGLSKLCLALIDMAGLIEERIAFFRDSFDKKGLYLRSELKEGLGLVCGDRQQLIKVIDNILDNALKFTDKGGLKIRAGQENEMIRFEFSDTGIGLEQDHLERIFDPFYQVEPTLTRVRGGTGLGLTVARYVVEAHRGKIWAESAGLDQGSTFYMLLPIECL